MKENILAEKSKKFALRIIKLYMFLKNEKHETIMSRQLLRCEHQYKQEKMNSENYSLFIIKY